MTERERFIKALRRQPLTGHCPTFELVFYLSLESIGRIHPRHQRFDQWDQMSETEKRLHIAYTADTYIEIAEKYHHSAIYVHANPGDFDNLLRLLNTIREKTGDRYFLMMRGDCTFGIPNGQDMFAFTERMYEDEAGLKAEAQECLEQQIAFTDRIAKYPELLDGFALCSDYCFNANPFFSPDMLGEYITPYLKQVIRAMHDRGFYAIKHTDGNIMPILDQLVECEPDALHSLDPQGKVDMGEVKRRYGDRIALCGNVNCGLLQTGTEEEVIADVRRSLRQGMDGWGYVFCTSNCAYTGMPLERYELMNRIWWEEGIYPYRGKQG